MNEKQWHEFVAGGLEERFLSKEVLAALNKGHRWQFYIRQGRQPGIAEAGLWMACREPVNKELRVSKQNSPQ